MKMTSARDPELLASSSSSHSFGINIQAKEPQSLDGQVYAKNFFKSAQWYFFLPHMG